MPVINLYNIHLNICDLNDYHLMLPIYYFTGNACTPNHCSNGGNCVTRGTQHTHIGLRHLWCVISISVILIILSYFFKIADVCSPNPCFNGGLCLQNGNSFTCQCINGFTGSNCQTSKCYVIDVYFVYSHR